jgi:hypothetical protein
VREPFIPADARQLVPPTGWVRAPPGCDPFSGWQFEPRHVSANFVPNFVPNSADTTPGYPRLTDHNIPENRRNLAL